MKIKLTTLIILILLLADPQSGRAAGDIMSNLQASGRLYDWTYTGVPGGIPNRPVCQTIATGASGSTIQSALNSSACQNKAVLLSPGTYNAGTLLIPSNVTLRGAGADATILTGGQVVTMGNTGVNPIAVGTAITGGGAKGSFSITVASLSGLSSGTMIQLDRNDDTNIVVNAHGQPRPLIQVNMITSVSGTTLALKNPLFYDFSAASGGKVKYKFTVNSFSGVEDLKFDHTGNSAAYGAYIANCYACWLKGIESINAASYHVLIFSSLNGEVRDIFLTGQNAGANTAGLTLYSNDAQGVEPVSNWKVENSIADRAGLLEVQNSCSGNYFGYNYGYDANIGTPSWMYDESHGPHDMMNLWEGNMGELLGADGYFGSDSHATVFRNYFYGYTPRSKVTDAPLRLNRWSYYWNVIGNVLGVPAPKPTLYEQTPSDCGYGIYRLGFPNIGNCGTVPYDGIGGSYPDPKVSATLVRWGNYDTYHNSTQWNSAEISGDVTAPSSQTLPASLYYSSQPTWWPAGTAWPPIGPDVSGGSGGGFVGGDLSGHVNKTPAQICFETQNLGSGSAFNAAKCYPKDYGAASVTPHPADTNVDMKITANEATSYGACWKSAPTVPSGCPANATMDNAVRAGTLWSSSVDGSYHFDSTKTCPLCWAP